MTSACEPRLKRMQMVGDRLPLIAAAQQAGDYESQARALINLAHVAR